MTQSSSLLSHRLRAETKDAHTAAERSGIMRSLLRGTLARPQYVALLQNLAELYDALETEIDRHGDHPALADVQWSQLRRGPALHEDIARLSDGAADAEISPVTREYVDHLHSLGNTAPELLFAHAYLRYLGDLYGGQIIRRIVQDKMHLDAVAFYDFENIENLDAFKHTFRNAIDAINPSIANPDKMVAEAMLGYVLHARLFKSLDADTA